MLPDTDDELHALYVRHFEAMTEVATSKFHLPSAVAAELAHGILLVAIHQSPRIENAATWFQGAISFASRHYLRGRG